MNLKDPQVILVIFITLIISSYVELNFGGSSYLAVLFFIISLILLSKFKIGGQNKIAPSKKFLILGSLILLGDILYNFKTGSEIQTLDTMLIFLGLSFIAVNIKNDNISNLGEFGVYFSSIFLLFFLVVYALPLRLGSNIYDYYGYYATTIPSIYILQSLGLSLRMDSLTTFHAYGIEDIYYKVDLGCFGFYSMLLILSTVFAFRITTPQNNKHSLMKITIILVFASFLANLARIIILVYIGYYYGLATMQIFHTFLGWALFAGIILPITYFYLK